MAKTSSVEKNNRRRRLVGPVRRQAQAPEGDRQRSEAPGGRALCGAHQAGRAAAQLLADAHPQPLRAHGPRARLLPQAQAVPQPAARAGEPGPDPRHDQVELVREQEECHERSPRRYADPHPQRADAAAPEGRRRPASNAARARPRRAGGRGLHPRLRARRAEGRLCRASRSSSSTTTASRRSARSSACRSLAGASTRRCGICPPSPTASASRSCRRPRA